MNVRALSLALAGLLALVFLSQGLTAPYEKDEESRPAGIIADIVHRGNWMLPADVYGEVTRKPPLYYWLSAAVAGARGGVVDEAGGRIVSVAAAAILSVMVMGYAGAWMGARAGWLAWLVLLGCYGFCSHAAYARTDMLFSMLIFGAFCVLYPAVEDDASRVSRWLAAGLMLGLATLTKGPLALVLCGLGIAVYLLLTGRNPLRLATRPWPWLTLAVAAAVASAWYVPALIKSHGGIAAVQLVQENLGHLMPARLGGTGEASRPLYYLLIRFAGTSLPLSLFIPALIIRLAPIRRVSRPELYQLGLLIAVLGLFSIASSKRDDYILPAFPPFAIILAAMLAARSESLSPMAARLRSLGAVSAGAAMLVMAIGGLIVTIRGVSVERWSAHLQSSDAAYLAVFATDLRHWHEMALMAAIAIVAAVSLVALLRRRTGTVAVAIALASVAGVSLWIGVIRPGLAVRRTFKHFAIRMRAVTGGAPVYTPGGPDYEISYYFGGPIRELALAPKGPGDSRPDFVLIWDNWPKIGVWTGSGEQILASHPASDGRRMVLLKIGANRFEPPLRKQ